MNFEPDPVFKVELFETSKGHFGVVYKVGFGHAGIEVFESHLDAILFIESLGVDVETAVMKDECVHG